MPDSNPSERARENRLEWWVGALFLLAYMAISWAFCDLYPFSTVPMYKGVSDFPAQRLVVLDPNGDVRFPKQISSVTCDGELPEGLVRCPEGVIPATLPQDGHAFHIPYLDLEILNRLKTLPGVKGKGVNLRVVRRTWFVTDPSGELSTLDCLVATCRGKLK